LKRAGAFTVQCVMAALSPDARERLLRRNPHLRPVVVRSVARGELVQAHARREGDRVTLVAEGLRLRLLPNVLKGMHPMKEASLRRREHEVVRRALAGVVPPAGPWRVEIVRVGPVAVDSDAAWTSAKGVRDEIAAWCGVDDGDSAWTWDVRGEVGKGYAVRVTVASREGAGGS
jgi:hypothetical protein